MATAEKTRPAGYRALREVTVPSMNGENVVHLRGAVLSPLEVSEFLKDKIDEGSARYRARFEPMSEHEVQDHREQATAREGDRILDGQRVSPPWPDYVGLHPEEVLERLQKTEDRYLVEQVKKYESVGLARGVILDFVAPVEREPWVGYDEVNVRDILAKFDVMSSDAVAEAITYECAHRSRPAIVSYEKDSE